MFKLALVLVLVSATAGCLGFLGGGEPEMDATVVVRNDVDPPTTMSIDVRKVGDDTETIGTVSAGQERSMTYRSNDLQGTYQLIARQSSGAAVTSRQFTLFENARVSWQIRSNTLTVTQP